MPRLDDLAYDPAVPDPGQRGTVEQLLWEMDQSGVDQACIVAADIERNPDNNAYVAECVARHPGRLHHIAHIDCFWEPTYEVDGAVARLWRLSTGSNAAGVTRYFGAEVTDWPLSREGMAFFESRRAPRSHHDLAARPVWQPQLREVARRCPGLPILLHHLGSFRAGGIPANDAYELMAPTLEQDNIYVKLSGFHYGGARNWEFPQVEAAAFAGRIHAVTGGRRLCWGSGLSRAEARSLLHVPADDRNGSGTLLLPVRS